jgi:hypothetical protein
MPCKVQRISPDEDSQSEDEIVLEHTTFNPEKNKPSTPSVQA